MFRPPEKRATGNTRAMRGSRHHYLIGARKENRIPRVNRRSARDWSLQRVSGKCVRFDCRL